MIIYAYFHTNTHTHVHTHCPSLTYARRQGDCRIEYNAALSLTCNTAERGVYQLYGFIINGFCVVHTIVSLADHVLCARPLVTDCTWFARTEAGKKKLKSTQPN